MALPFLIFIYDKTYFYYYTSNTWLGSVGNLFFFPFVHEELFLQLGNFSSLILIYAQNSYRA